MHLTITTNLDETPWTHLQHATPAIVEAVGRLVNGTTQGKEVTALHIRTEDGQDIIAQVKQEHLELALQGFKARAEYERSLQG